MMKRNRCIKRIFISCMCLVMGTGFVSCGSGQETEVPELLVPVAVTSSTVACEKRDISNLSIYKAQAIPYTEELSFSTPGFIGEIRVNIGDKVKKGDILAVLSGAEDSALLKDAEESITEAKRNNEENNLMLEYDIKILEAEIKSGEGDVAVKKVELKIAKEELASQKRMQKIELDELYRQRDITKKYLEQFYLYSSMDGIVSCIAQGVGDQVASGSFVIAISDPDMINVKSEYVSSRDIKNADDYYVVDNDKIYTVMQQESDPVEIKSLMDEDLPVYSYYDVLSPAPEFKVGDYLELYVENNVAKDALVLPANAVYKNGTESYVYKDENGNKIRTDVELGTETASFVQVTSGLKEGDVVYVKP